MNVICCTTIYLKRVLQLNDSVCQFTLNAFMNYSVGKLNIRIDVETVNLSIYAKNILWTVQFKIVHNNIFMNTELNLKFK